MKMKTAYSVPGWNYSYPRRLRETAEFIKFNGLPSPVLVAGGDKDFEPHLNKRFPNHMFVNYTDHDLNWRWPIREQKYYTIMSFQVIEHLLNPLLFLTECKRVLEDDGLIYITYPTHGTKMFWSSGHFNEYDRSRFLYLIKEAGLKIVDYKSHILWRRINGLRPLLRNTPIGWCRHHYYSLSKEE